MKFTAYCLLSAATSGLAVAQDFGPQQAITTSADSGRCVYATDLDGDGDADVLSASLFDDKIAWYENQGDGVFGGQQVITTSADGPFTIYATDLDGDGDADVLSASLYDDTIAWYENQGGGLFGGQQVITTSTDNAYSVYATDLDGDGDVDVLSASSLDNKIAWYENNTSLGIFMGFGPQQIITTEAKNAQCVYATDLDGDGDADVLSASRDDHKIAWYENQGGGVFGGQLVITTSALTARSVYATDLDGDGDADVLSASFGDDKIAWYENQGGGIFGGQQVITTDAKGTKSVYATDLDEDGDADVLATLTFLDQVAWYENQGGGVFGGKKVITTLATGAPRVYATDLDGDGDADVLSISIYDDKVTWYENLMGGSALCNVVFCDTDAANLGNVTLSTCDCSGGSITIDLWTSFPGQFTYPLVGLGTTAVSPTGVSELCLAGSTIGRYANDAGAINALGNYSVDLLNAASAPGGGVPTIGGALCNGNTWRFQYWHRDGMNPSRFSKGISGLIN